MIITCPHCKTHFRLADEKVREGVRARCSVCDNVLVLSQDFIQFYAIQESIEDTKTGEVSLYHKDENTSAEMSGTLPNIEGKADSIQEENECGSSEESKSGGWLWLFILTLILVAGVLYYMQPQWLNNAYQQYFGTNQAPVQKQDLVSRIVIRNDKYEAMQNEHIGTLGVVSGVAVNNFETPRSHIRVEAELKDANGKAFESKALLAGNTLTLLQLQTLPREEIEAILNNEAGVKELNGNVASKCEVPFMLIFYNPLKAEKYTIKVVDASIPSEDNK